MKWSSLAFFAGLSLAIVGSAQAQHADPPPHDSNADYADAGVYPKGDCCPADVYCGPRVTARLNAVFMTRDEPDALNIFNDPGGVELLNVADFDFDTDAGTDASLICHGCRADLELRVFALAELTATREFLVPAGENTVNTSPVTSFFGPTAGNAFFEYESNLRSAEVNSSRRSGAIRYLAGFRYADFSEDLSGQFPFFNPGAPPAVPPFIFTQRANWSADNNMYGFQLGAEGDWQRDCSRWGLSASAKAGVYYNDIRTSFRYDFNNGAAPAIASANDDDIAFLGEAGLFGTFDINCHCRIRAGYQLMWLEGVAVASDQIASTGVIASGPVPSAVDSNGSVLFHGATVGVEFSR